MFEGYVKSMGFKRVWKSNEMTLKTLPKKDEIQLFYVLLTIIIISSDG